MATYSNPSIGDGRRFGGFQHRLTAGLDASKYPVIKNLEDYSAGLVRA
jgi:hypothetical protein